jgi:hypothetical protein
MKVIYVAGPFRAENAWAIECNIREAERVALEVWNMGCAAICPHTNTRFFQGAAPDDVWLKGDIEIMKRCDAVILTSDWPRSSGAKEEKRVAEQSGIPVFETLAHLGDWLIYEEKKYGRKDQEHKAQSLL